MTTINNRGLKGNPTLPYSDFRSFAGEDVVVDLTFLDRTGQAVTPYQVQWQLDDISNAINMQPPTILGTGTFTTNTSTLTLPASLMQMDKQFQGSQLCQLSLAMSYLDTRVTPSVSRTVQEQYVIELVANQTPLGTILAPTAAPSGSSSGTVPGLPTGGAVFIATFGATVLNSYIYSVDGVAWSVGTFATSDNFAGAAFGGSPTPIWVVMTGSRAVQTSPNGVSSWTNSSTALPNGFQGKGVAWSPTLKLFVAIDSGLTSAQVATSPDGLVWTSRATPTGNFNWADIVWSARLGLFIAVISGSFTTNSAMTSPDGIIWTMRTDGNNNIGLVHDFGSAFNILGVQPGSVTWATSPDGANWTSGAFGTIPGGGNAIGNIFQVGGAAYSLVRNGPVLLIKNTNFDLSGNWQQVQSNPVPGVVTGSTAGRTAFSTALGLWAMMEGTVNNTQIVTTKDAASFSLIVPSTSISAALQYIAAAG